MEKTANVKIAKSLRYKKPPQPVRMQRSADEWKKIVEDAKRKETYWARGIVPGKGEFVGADEESSTY